MLPLRTQAKQHDDEVDSSANANPGHLTLNSHFPRWRTAQANPVVPRQAFHTLILVIRSLSQSCRSSQQFWWHPHLCPNTKHEGP